MAQVTMDSSEYELMKENKTLLEKSLQKERELSAEIDRLNKEKIDNFKKSEHQVLITTKSYITEEVIENLEYKDLIYEIVDLYEKAKKSRDYVYFDPKGLFLRDLKDRLFKVVKLDKEPIETYSLKNLDDIIPDIKSNLKSQLDKETKEKLSTIPLLKRDLEFLSSKRNKLENENNELSEELENLKFHYDELKQMITLHTWQDFALFEIKDTLLSVNVFNFKKNIKKIFDLLETKPAMKAMYEVKVNK